MRARPRRSRGCRRISARRRAAGPRAARPRATPASACSIRRSCGAARSFADGESCLCPTAMIAVRRSDRFGRRRSSVRTSNVLRVRALRDLRSDRLAASSHALEPCRLLAARVRPGPSRRSRGRGRRRARDTSRRRGRELVVGRAVATAMRRPGACWRARGGCSSFTVRPLGFEPAGVLGCGRVVGGRSCGFLRHGDASMQSDGGDESVARRRLTGQSRGKSDSFRPALQAGRQFRERRECRRAGSAAIRDGCSTRIRARRAPCRG